MAEGAGCPPSTAYTLNSGTKIWIITEADRSATTLLSSRIDLLPRSSGVAGLAVKR
jgi:hypothetical protein